jgi:hypothetical protein
LGHPDFGTTILGPPYFGTTILGPRFWNHDRPWGGVLPPGPMPLYATEVKEATRYRFFLFKVKEASSIVRPCSGDCERHDVIWEELALHLLYYYYALPTFTIYIYIHISDIGRIYIKGYLYPISYPKIAKKDIPLSFF